ncbi:MAG: membrane-bound dehydrogenase domain-containing protein, partial [Planctomycetota bacterium]
EGAIAALKSPNEATRYVAWTALVAMGEKAEPALKTVFEKDKNPRHRARAMWLLPRLRPATDPKNDSLTMALKDSNEDIRCVAVRAIRQLAKPIKVRKEDLGDTPQERLLKKIDGPISFEAELFIAGFVELLAGDKSAAVRRECLVALRNLKSPKKPELWAKLAMQHDGKDRWYLEALGIGAGNDWDACLEACMKTGNKFHQDIIWRSRSTKSPEYLAKTVAAPSISSNDAPRLLRAFDFLPASQAKDDALVQLAFGSSGDEQKVALVSAEALNRLKGFDVSKNEAQKAALNRVLDSLKGQPQFLTLVEKFNVTDRYPDLLALAQAKPDDQIGIDAIRVLLAKNQQQLLTMAVLPAVKKDRPDVAKGVIGLTTALSNSGDTRVVPLLLPLVKTPDYPAVVQDDKRPAEVRRAAIRGAALTQHGAQTLLKMAQAKSLDESFTPAISSALIATRFANVRDAAMKIYPPPAGKDSKPLPPLTELAKLKGNAGNGAKLFDAATTAKCNTCHVVNNQGKEVGPNLSEIGSKLSRQAMWESIIFPSAGISHNFESYVVETKSGTVANGLKISEDAESVTLRGADALARTFKKSDIEEIKKQEISLMPADLAKTLSIEEMSDLVEYLTTLKKK